MDRIFPLKIESPEFGTQDDQGFPTEADPNQDYIATKGISFTNSENHIIEILDNEVVIKDPINGIVKQSEIKSKLNRLQKDQTLLALEVLSLKDQDYDPNLSFFVDSFNDTDFINPASQNYEVNPELGYVSATQGSNKTISESTISQFNQGYFNNIESFQDSGGDGALRKNLVIIGNQTVLEDFEDVTNVNTYEKNVIYFENFEDGDISDWYFELIDNDADTGLETDNIIGNYGIRIDGDDRAYSPSFDCSGLSNVKVKMYLAAPSMNNDDEELVVGWYDGSTWYEIHAAEDDDQGYVTVDIPDAWLASNNQLVFDNTNNSTLFGGVNGSGDIGLIDDIEVAAINFINISQESTIGYVYSGSYSGKFYVNFENDYNEFEIQLSNIDISLYKYIRLFMLKPSNGIFKYKITIQDNSLNIWDTGNLDFPDTYNWFYWEELINNISGINTSNIIKLKVEFIEITSDAILFELESPESTNVETLVSSREFRQTFLCTETITVGRIQMHFRSRNSQPRLPLYVGLANVFDTTYAIAVFNGNQTPGITYGTPQPAISDFDKPVTLIKNQEYTLLFKTNEDNWNYAWDIQLTNYTDYEDGTFYWGTNPQNRDITFSLLSPKVSENIYFDNLTIEAESTYEVSGDYTSSKINLGITPDSLDKLYWNKTGSSEDLEVRIKFASTELGLDSASWWGWYTDETGVNNNLSSITPKKWFQYQVRWINGTDTESDKLKDISLDYSTSGVSQSTVISIPNLTVEEPSEFIFRYQDKLNNGTIGYYISRNNGINWQYIDRSTEGEYQTFNGAGSGNEIILKAELTQDAELYGWSLATNEEFV